VFQPKFVKHAKLFLKGVTKFIHYKRDILPEGVLGNIEQLRGEFSQAIKEKDKGKLDGLAKELTDLCDGALPEQKNPGLRENVEVIFVAVVIVLGIRSYIVQPFKIPTNSMYPTLHGVVGTPQWEPDASGELPEQPGFLKKKFDYVFRMRNYVDVRAPETGRLVSGYEKTHFRFFTFTYLEMASGRKLKIYAPMREVVNSLGLGRFSPVMQQRKGAYFLRFAGQGVPVTKGQVLVRGHVDAGDQVLVNKFTYHFRRPERGEIFVFTTKGIRGIENTSSFDPRQGSQHYIKRLAGVPGDNLEVKQPDLWINGKRAEEPGFVKVMDGANDKGNAYRGYKKPSSYRFEETLREDEYVALGDNSYQSADSRSWGTVPRKNLVGPAFFVYLPFLPHWGVPQ